MSQGQLSTCLDFCRHLLLPTLSNRVAALTSSLLGSERSSSYPSPAGGSAFSPVATLLRMYLKGQRESAGDSSMQDGGATLQLDSPAQPQ